ncbi:protease pro-enzyme activation domain-containing protein, partial [Corallococcus praedator]|uniref:protease pro-enzyme activation domain-containing protein n=1 Tax=Corallococcus praedator TaxID=2316724 RepID=UPI001ABFB3B1
MNHYSLLGLLLLTACGGSRPFFRSTMETTERMYAQVVLKAPTGQSVTKTTATADQIDRLQPDSTTVAETTAALEKAGFRIEQPGVTLSISGPKQRFESIFQIRLTAYKQGGQTYYRP